jgi:xanthine dehydrogenase YagR molybdenum-binding subunit
MARAEPDGRFVVRIAAADIGTGARTVLSQIAADALGVGLDAVRLELGDSRYPAAGVAGGSSGTAKWGTAVVRACEALLARLSDEGAAGPDGVEVTVDTADEVRAQAKLARAAFGAQFVEARVDVETGEVRVPRALGVFGVGRVLNPKLARSQLVGGMTMGISMALFEEGVLDVRFGDVVNHDLASYHVAACADIADLDAVWVEEQDDELNPMGSKGIGEIGIVGTAAAVANAVHHATGVRVRDLPLRLDRLVGPSP